MQRDAWCLKLSNQQTLAVAQQQVVEYLTHVSACVVPRSNPDCNQVILWRDRVVPVWGADPIADCTVTQQHVHILVISYLESVVQDESVAKDGTEPNSALLALSLTMAPVLLSVCDDDRCQPSSSQLDYWQQSILACFQYQNNPVPVIGFSQLSRTT